MPTNQPSPTASELADALEKRGHYDCEDCWYSCPMSGECCDDSRTANPKCDCGHDTDLQAAAALRSMEIELRELRVKLDERTNELLDAYEAHR
jgi:hypothetical protein